MFCNCGYHESDLSWLIKLIKQALDEWKNVQNEWKDMQEWITNYFENLDIPTEIKKVIQEMINDGSFQQIVQNMLSHFVHVKYYGAKGDGVTDDTAAIQACIDANPNCEIFFDTGVYRVTAAIRPYCQYGAQTLNLNASRIFYDGTGNDAVILYKDKNLGGFPDDKMGAPILKNGVLDGNNKSNNVYYAETYFPKVIDCEIRNFNVCGIMLGRSDGESHISQRAVIENVQITQQTQDSTNLNSVGVIVYNPDCIFKNVVILSTHIGFALYDEGHLLEQCHFWPQFRTKPVPSGEEYKSTAILLTYYSTDQKYFRSLIKDFYFDECTYCISADGKAWWAVDVNGFWLAQGEENNNAWTQYFINGKKCVVNGRLVFPYGNTRYCLPFNRTDTNSTDLLYEYENSNLEITPLGEGGIVGRYNNRENIMLYSNGKRKICLDEREQLKNGKYYYLGLIVSPRAVGNYLYRIKVGHQNIAAMEVYFRKNPSSETYDVLSINRIIQNNDYDLSLTQTGYENKTVLIIAVHMKGNYYDQIWCEAECMQPDYELYLCNGEHIEATGYAWRNIALQED